MPRVLPSYIPASIARERHLWRRGSWTKLSPMSEYDFDLFTIGGGSGGVRGARIAASYGAKVAVAEEKYLGGTCVNVGCIPKKMLVYASHYAEDFEDARAFGWDVESKGFDWAKLKANKDNEIDRLKDVYRGILGGAGVKVFDSRATIVDAHTVQVGDQRVTAKYILVATGGRPRIPHGHGEELVMTSDDVFAMAEMPKRLLIVGGGYIATEFAGIFHGLGSKVTQIYRGPMFLRGFDDDVRRTVAEEMRKKEVDLRFDTHVSELDRTDDGAVIATFTNGDTVVVDACVFAIGRMPYVAGLGLGGAGVETNKHGAIIVDDYGKTNVDSIYAIGDVTDRIQLTPVALAEGMAVAATLFDGRPTKPDHVNVPSAVFSQPSIGTIGMTEREARDARDDVVIFRSAFRPLRHSITGRDAKTMMKLVVCGDTDQVLGVHVVGPHAGEIVQGFAVAVKMGATKRQLDATIGIHPTSAEELVTMRTPVAELA
jgi:glutathione reductase (NADPH)